VGERDFEPLGGRKVFQGRIIDVGLERFRFSDGTEVEREIVHHPGAAAIVAVDEEFVWLVRQPRPAVTAADVLEIPAGLLDVEGEEPLEAAKRELAEEIGKAGERWEHLISYWSSVGIMDELVHLYLVQGLSDADAESHEHERIEIVPWPLADLDGAIAATRDAKTLIGLMLLRARGLAGGGSVS
jgi:8-oxo-dGTP pyrophosphatase MutT (NUDIX family)